MHVSASFTDHRDAQRTLDELGERGISAELEPLANVDQPLADPVLVRAMPHDPEGARIVVEAFVHHGGALLSDPASGLASLGEERADY